MKKFLAITQALVRLIAMIVVLLITLVPALIACIGHWIHEGVYWFLKNVVEPIFIKLRDDAIEGLKKEYKI